MGCGESAGNSCENGSLSPVAVWGAGSTGLSGGTWHFHPRGKVPGFSAKTVHFPPWLVGVPAPQASLAVLGISTSRESAGNFGENGSLSPVAVHFPLGRFIFPGGWSLLEGSSRACIGKCLVYSYSEKGHLLDLG